MTALTFFVFFQGLFSTALVFAEGQSLDGIMAQNHINSVQKALEWEKGNIPYKIYGGHAWESEKKVLDSGNSSCQGFASLNYEILKRLGYEPSIYIFNIHADYQGDRHAVVIFKDGKYYNAISNKDLITSKEISLQAFIFYLGLCHDLHFPVEYRK